MNDVIVSAATKAQFARDYAELMYRPKWLPPVTEIMLSSTGDVWVRREETGEEKYAWDILSPAGIPLGRVHLGRYAKVLAAGKDIVWVSELEDGVPGVTRYRVIRR